MIDLTVTIQTTTIDLIIDSDLTSIDLSIDTNPSVNIDLEVTEGIFTISEKSKLALLQVGSTAYIKGTNDNSYSQSDDIERSGSVSIGPLPNTNSDRFKVSNDSKNLFIIREDGLGSYGKSDPATLNEFFEFEHTFGNVLNTNTYGLRSTINFDMPSGADQQYSSFLAEAIIPLSNSTNFTNLLRAGYYYLNHRGLGTIASAVTLYPITRVSGGGTITNAYEIQTSTQVTGNSTITDLRHMEINPAVIDAGSEVTNEYGLYLNGISANPSYKPLFVSGSKKAEFQGGILTGDVEVTSGKRVLLDNGSAALPAITFAGDENTGIYRPGVDQLGLSTAGVQRIFLLANGRVGIGISPAYNFHVAGDINGTARFRLNGVATLENDVAGRLALGEGYDKVWIRNSGNVGIGTAVSNPSEKLHVGGNAKIAGTLEVNAIPVYASTAAGVAALTTGKMFRVSNGDGSSALHIVD